MGMGSVVWSADTIILSFLQPAVFAYNNKNYAEACTNLNSLNEFFKGFGVGIADLPTLEVRDRGLKAELATGTQAKIWFETYFPAIAKSMGMYLRETIDLIKSEHGTL